MTVGGGYARITQPGRRDTVYRGFGPGFIPGPANLVGESATAAFDDSTFFFSGSYYYRVVALDLAANRSGPSVVTGRVMPADADRGGRPVAYDLGSAVPNPARAGARMVLALPEPSRVDVAVFAANGSRVVTLLSGEQPSGLLSLQWDGRNAGGILQPSGVYVVRVDAQGQTRAHFSESRKLIWMR